MDKKTILKKLLGEEIASYLRPIIREKADLMLSTKTPQHGFTKKVNQQLELQFNSARIILISLS